MKIKFLIIRFSSIGDIVLTTPVIRGLKSRIENSEVHYLSKPEYKGVLENNPYIDKIHLLNYKLNDSIEELKSEGFDYVIDLHNNIRTKRIKHKLKVLDFTFNKINIKKWLLVNLKINKLPDKHIVDRYMETLSVFDVMEDKEGLDYFIPESDKVKTDEKFPAEFHPGYIAWAIGGKHNTKKLASEKIIEICKKIKQPVVLLGGKEDKAAGEEITANCENAINFCGSLNLNESASVIEQSNLVITHDTGLMHIAAAFKKKIISIWGNTIPEFGMYPYLPDKESKIFEVKQLKCRPCTKIGYKKCPKKHFRCMKDQDSESIAKYVDTLFNKN